MGLKWNPNELAVLKRMFERGDPPADMAAELRRTTNAVSTMATRLGLKRPVDTSAPLSATGHQVPVLLNNETVRRIDRQPGKRSPYLRRAVLLQLAIDEAGIEGTPAELVALLKKSLW